MNEPRSLIYEPLTGKTPSGEVLVQLFRDPQTREIITASVAFRRWPWDTWGVPYDLEVR